MAPTIKEIAKKANVSIATVSRALNDDSRVTPETRKKVLRISEDLNYKPNLVARNFVKKTPYTLGLILPDITDEFFTEIIKGVDEITFNNGYYTMVDSSHKHRSLTESITAFSNTGLVGGIILLLSSMTDEIKNILLQSKIPVVLISGGKAELGFDTVAIDNYQDAFNATEYLIKEKQFKRIAHITGPKENDDAFLRKKGFLDACKKNNIVVSKSFIQEGDFTRESGYHSFLKLLKSSKRPEAIFAANDYMALGCYDACASLGLKIPEDVALIGFDDIFVSQYLSPPLTTVRVQIEEVGRTAAKILVKKLNGTNGKVQPIIKISTNLIIRDSC